MVLNLIVGDYSMDLEVPETYLQEANELYAKMDQDMDKGWQMGREWVAHPDRLQRCQIVADKLLDALETDNHRLALVTAGYILTHMPGTRSVNIDNSGEMTGTTFSG